MAVVDKAWHERKTVMTRSAAKWRFAGCLFGAAFSVLAASAQDAPKDPLPDAPGKNVVVSKCTQCHEASRFALLRKSGDDWEQVITQMTSNGLTLTDEEYGIVLNYLTKNLSPSAAPAKTNINRTSVDDLQRFLSITDIEAASSVKHRKSSKAGTK